MLRFSFSSLALTLLGLVTGQQTQLPQTEVPAVTAGPDPSQCGGCFIVGDIVGIVFGADQVTVTDEVTVAVETGRNGSLSTRTITQPISVTEVATVTQGVTQFSIASTGLLTTGANGDLTAQATGTTLVIGGQTLTSPTAYQLFSQYAVTSTVFSNGRCVAMEGTTITTSVFVYTVPAGADAAFPLSAQQSFASSIGLPTCSAGGGDLSTMTQTPVTTTTQMTTITGNFNPTPTPITTPAADTAPSTTEATSITLIVPSSLVESASSTVTSVSSVSVTIVVSNGTSFGTGAIPSMTIMPFPGEGMSLTVSPLLMWFTGVLGLILTAWIL